MFGYKGHILSNRDRVCPIFLKVVEKNDWKHVICGYDKIRAGTGKAAAYYRFMPEMPAAGPVFK
jgi:hypothetical protein